MRRPLTWRTAFLRQARSDYAMFLRLQSQPNVPLCHKLHFLQMATEKLAKGFAVNENERPARTHVAFVAFIHSVQRNSKLRPLIGSHVSQAVGFVNSVLSVAEALEGLAPVGDIDRPSPEYPWENEGVIYVPIDYTFDKLGATKKVSLNPESPRMRKLLGFIEACFEMVKE